MQLLAVDLLADRPIVAMSRSRMVDLILEFIGSFEGLCQLRQHMWVLKTVEGGRKLCSLSYHRQVLAGSVEIAFASEQARRSYSSNVLQPIA